MESDRKGEFAGADVPVRGFASGSGWIFLSAGGSRGRASRVLIFSNQRPSEPGACELGWGSLAGGGGGDGGGAWMYACGSG